jgi:hypothetical protein
MTDSWVQHLDFGWWGPLVCVVETFSISRVGSLWLCEQDSVSLRLSLKIKLDEETNTAATRGVAFQSGNIHPVPCWRHKHPANSLQSSTWINKPVSVPLGLFAEVEVNGLTSTEQHSLPFSVLASNEQEILLSRVTGISQAEQTQVWPETCVSPLWTCLQGSVKGASYVGLDRRNQHSCPSAEDIL